MTADKIFLGRVGHDLRGELATMVNGVDYLRRYEADLAPTVRQMLDRVSGAGQRMKRLLDEFDDAAWIDGGSRAGLEIETCDTELLVKDALGRLNSTIETLEVAIDLELPSGLPPFHGDKRLCGVAIEHVLDFALSRSKKKTVHVTAALHDGRPMVTIVDEGGSIPEEAHGRIFEPFAEMELLPPRESGQRRRNRLGLGLAIARGILAAHGGAVKAENGGDGRGLALACVFSHADVKAPWASASSGGASERAVAPARKVG